MDNLIEHLKNIHFKCDNYLKNKDFVGLANYMNSFLREDVDPNELKMVMIITKGFKDNPIISEIRTKVVTLFDKKLEELLKGVKAYNLR